MKHIATHLSEQHFLSRLETLCRKKERFDRSYRDEDVFVIKRSNSNFRIAKHYAQVGRTDGYASDCLYCRYRKNEKGYITVDYHLGKTLTSFILFIICFPAGIALWISLIYEAIAFSNVEWGAMCVATLFWVFGLATITIRSKKERVALEQHLLRICSNIT